MEQKLAMHIIQLRAQFSQYCSEAIGKMGLSQGLLHFLLFLSKHPGSSPGELSQALHTDSGYTARAISRLEQKKFLIKRKNPSDGRGVLLYLTDCGELAVKHSIKIVEDWEELILRRIEPEQRELFLALLQCAAQKGEIQQDENGSCVYQSHREHADACAGDCRAD